MLYNQRKEGEKNNKIIIIIKDADAEKGQCGDTALFHTFLDVEGCRCAALMLDGQLHVVEK